MPTYALTIGGSARVVRPGWSISETANGRNTMTLDVVSVDGSYRPAIDDQVILTEDGTRIFGGLVTAPAEAWLGDRTWAGHSTRVAASDFSVYADRKHVTAEIVAGTLKAALVVVATYLSDFGVTLDAGQVDGPSLAALSYDARLVKDVLDELATITGYYWEIDYNKILRMKAVGSAAAPFNVADGDGNVEGDLTAEPDDTNRANYVILLAGTGVKDVADTVGPGDGVTTTFQLRYTPAAFYLINVGGTLVDGWPSGGVNETIGTAPAIWSYDAATNRITRTTGAPGVGVTIYPTMSAQFPLRVVADGGAPAASRRERIYTATAVFDATVAQAIADGYLARDNVLPTIARYRTARTGIHPGQTQTLASARRGVASATYLVTDVEIFHLLDQQGVGSLVRRRVTATSASRVPGGWRETVKSWGGEGGGATAAAGTVVFTSIVGTSGSGSTGVVAGWSAPTALGNFTQAASTILGNNTGVTASPLALTVAQTKTLLAIAQADVAGLTTSDSPTFGGITLTGVAITRDIRANSSDNFDLGRYDRLWRKLYVSTIAATVFEFTTATLFGGYSIVGKQAGAFSAGVSAGDTTINFGQTMTPSDWVIVRAADTGGTVKAEYLQVGTLVSGTTYNVTRDLAASYSPDPAWAAGTPFLVLGASGDGRVEILAYDGKPRIAFLQQGATYGASSVRGVVGNLNGYFGYATDVHGAAFGDASTAWIKIDPTNGVRIGYNADTHVSLSSASGLVAGGVELSKDGLYINPVAASGGGTYANAKAVRWTTDTTLRTAIWRSDDTSATPIKEWNLDHIQTGGATVYAKTWLRTKHDAKTSPASSLDEAYLLQWTKDQSTFSCEAQLVCHDKESTTHNYAWLFLSAGNPGSGSDRAVLAVGTTGPSSTGSGGSYGTPAGGIVVSPSTTDVVGQLRWDTAAVLSWVSKSVDTVYQAAGDGFVVTYSDGTGGSVGGDFKVLTDASNPPTTARARMSLVNLGYSSMMCPVKKGDYYKVVTNVTGGTPTFTAFWVPMGLTG